MSIQLIVMNIVLVLGLMTALWVYSVFKRDVSIVDPWWSMCFLLVTVHTALRCGLTPANTLLLAMVSVWAVRLWLHLLLRAIGQPEDPRYQAFRQRFGADRYWWFSYFQVFLLQGALALLISAPLQLAASAPAPDALTGFDVAGALVFVFGFGFEVVADRQLKAFRDDPKNRGQILDTGLWRWSRHPNYFGEAVLWWGFGLCALDQPLGWLTLLGPVLMTYLLVKVSGVSMLDAHMRASRPGYAAYMDRTSAFIPWMRRTSP